MSNTIKPNTRKDSRKKSTEKNIDYLHEFVMTFTNGKSLFSSKKMERFIVFWTFLIMTIIYLSLNIRIISSWDFVEILALWLAYGGYNSLMGLRDKKLSRDNRVSELEEEVNNYTIGQSDSTSE